MRETSFKDFDDNDEDDASHEDDDDDDDDDDDEYGDDVDIDHGKALDITAKTEVTQPKHSGHSWSALYIVVTVHTAQRW